MGKSNSSDASLEPLTPEAALKFYEAAREQLGLGALPELTIEASGPDWIIEWEGKRDRRPPMNGEAWELWLREQFGPRHLLETLEG